MEDPNFPSVFVRECRALADAYPFESGTVETLIRQKTILKLQLPENEESFVPEDNS
jgi:hypothetical protein